MDRIIELSTECFTRSDNFLPSSVQACVGAGRAAELLRFDAMAHLKRAAAECGFRQVRFHGLLHDDMGVYRELDGKPVLGTLYIDTLFDALIDVGIRPFVEFGFMPSELASGPETIFWWKGNITPPRDYSRWEWLISSLLGHWIERYGEDEVIGWNFEVWNEPDLSYFFEPKEARLLTEISPLFGQLPDPLGFLDDERNCRVLAEYLELYESTLRAVASVSPRCRVGGPATAAPAMIAPFLALCRKRGTPVHFVSTHAYAVGPGLDEKGTQQLYLKEDPNVLGTMFDAVRDYMIRAGCENLPLHITEWSSSYSPRDRSHDSWRQAAWLLHNICFLAPKADSFSYWTVTDVFEEPGPPSHLFHGGFGLITANGIPKPAFHAWRLVKALGEARIPEGTAHCLIGGDDGTYRILCWEPVGTPEGMSNEEFFGNRNEPPRYRNELTLSLGGLTPGRRTIRMTRLGYGITDPWTLWKNMETGNLTMRERESRLRAEGDCTTLTWDTLIKSDGIWLWQTPIGEGDIYFFEIGDVQVQEPRHDDT